MCGWHLVLHAKPGVHHLDIRPLSNDAAFREMKPAGGRNAAASGSASRRFSSSGCRLDGARFADYLCTSGHCKVRRDVPCAIFTNDDPSIDPSVSVARSATIPVWDVIQTFNTTEAFTHGHLLLDLTMCVVTVATGS